MAIKKYNPRTPSRRFMSVSDYTDLTKKKPEKSLLEPLKKTGGRSNQGVTTSRFRGGGHKRRYRKIDFKRKRDGVKATVKAIEYDPNRSGRIALIEYEDNEKSYILAPAGLKVGSVVESGERVAPRVGNCMELRYVPLGLSVHCVELVPGRGGQLVRSAGSGAQVSARDGKYVHLILPSGEVRKVPNKCRGTIGVTSNSEHSSVTIGKAGRSRWLGRKPHVRAKAMNPVDHPLGGGESRSNGGRHPCSPTGVPAKGGKTRKRQKHSNRLIVQKRK